MRLETRTKTITEEIKGNAMFIKKNLHGFLGGLLFAFSIFSIVSSAVFFLFKTDVIKFGQANINQAVSDERDSQISVPTQEILCEGGIFADNLEKWEIKYYRVDEEGFYCLRKSSGFSSPDIWYKNLIPTNFQSLEIRYKLKNKDNNANTIPSFIFSIGKNPRIFRLYIPEKNPQIVGCEATNSDFSIERKEAHSLNEPIEWEADSEIKIRVMINKGNESRFDINLNYLSSLDGKPVEEYFNYNVILPDPKPESELSKIAIGFATLRGNCVKPISYKFCY